MTSFTCNCCLGADHFRCARGPCACNICGTQHPLGQAVEEDRRLRLRAAPRRVVRSQRTPKGRDRPKAMDGRSGNAVAAARAAGVVGWPKGLSRTTEAEGDQIAADVLALLVELFPTEAAALGADWGILRPGRGVAS